MLIKEFRIVMPFSVEDYEIGQLYSTATQSLNETGGGDGIEIVRNEPFENFPLFNGLYSKGQYTYKIYHLASKVPQFIRLLAPKECLIMHEEAWSSYPYCRTIITNPGYMKDNFYLNVKTLHLADNGQSENVHQLSPDKLQQREVITIDIAQNEAIQPGDYSPSQDPNLIKSHKFNVGPLTGSWIDTAAPVMTSYKLVTAEFKWLGFQNRIENYLLKTEQRIFTNLNRILYCTADEWHGMNMNDIRALEDKVRDELEKARKYGAIRGSKDESE